MDTTLDVLVIESHPGVADRAVGELTDAGHAVHRCHDGATAFPCAGVDGPDRCPVDGHVDVALLVRRGVVPSPTPFEDGVPCALRAGIPVVEHGTDLHDPYVEHLGARVRTDESVSDACGRAVAEAMRPSAAQVEAALVPFLRANGLPDDAVEVTLEARRDDLRVHLRARGNHEIGSLLTGQLSVKAVDVIRQQRRTWSSIEVDAEL
jgi:hypothetical protein